MKAAIHINAFIEKTKGKRERFWLIVVQGKKKLEKVGPYHRMGLRANSALRALEKKYR